MDYERPPPPHNRTTSSSSSNSASSELFICFTSRLSSSSSSSMKLSSKSILSPGRTDKQISLSASLSRRLRNNGSIKGGQSPMFPTGAKKRGSGFENTEPTSPKVTCIGQVRVKTKKKQAMKMRSMSKRRGSSGEASFRRIEQKQLDQNHHHHQHQHSGYLQQQLQQSQSQHQQQQQDGLQQRNQKWVHLPLTICEALRAFGAEFNCFLPCRSSCMSNERDQKEKMNHGSSSIDDGDQNSTRSCGAVFARWLVAMQEGEGKTREIELVVGGEEEEEGTERRSYHRRHVMEDIDINEVEKCNAEKIGVVEEGEGEQGRVSICVPPKNALLLMRCRSDPLRMAALANRFWESPVTKDENFEDIKDEDDEERDHGNEQEEEEEDMKEILEKEESLEVVLETEHEIVCKFEELVVHEADEEECGVSEDTTNLVIMEVNEQVDTQKSFQEINHYEEEIAEIEEEEEEEDKGEDDEVKAAELMSDSSQEALVDPEIQEIEVIEAELVQEKEENDGEFEEDEERRVSLHSSVSPLSMQSEKEEENQEMEAVAESETTMVRPLEEEEETEKSTMEKETTQSPSSEEEEETTVTHQRSEPETHESDKEEEEEEEAELERESHQQQPINLVRESRSTTTLPDCLLLMMCEPKLSMEVSKETWVCSTDFIRCVPSTAEKKKVIKTDGRDAPKRRVSIDSHPGVATRKKVLLQPPRSSCSFPTAVAAASAAAAAQGVSMATMIEQKLGNSVAYEPFVLKRCKSEPMRNAAKFAQPEACFWKNRKLEPHHRGAAVGVGAAGIGF